MTKFDLIARMARRYPQLATKDVEIAVNAILNAMTSSLVNGQRIEIRKFGSFKIHYRLPRTCRNPKTGKKVSVPEKCVPQFRPGSELRERVDS